MATYPGTNQAQHKTTLSTENAMLSVSKTVKKWLLQSQTKYSGSLLCANVP